MTESGVRSQKMENGQKNETRRFILTPDSCLPHEIKAVVFSIRLRMSLKLPCRYWRRL